MFLYYLPDTPRTVSLEDLAEAGLAHVFSSAPGESSFTPCPLTGSGGPDGKHGVIIADSRMGKIGYYPNEQTWLQMPEALLPQLPAVSAQPEARIPRPEARTIPWVGFYTADPPGPDDLIRVRPMTGHLVRMNDDREWLAPIARGWNDDEKNPGSYVALPTLTTLGNNGEWTTGSVAPKFEPLWEIATRFLDEMQLALDGKLGKSEDNKTTFDFAGQNDAALTALQANYRLGKMEVALLGLFTDQCTGDVLHALIDGPTFKEWIKKKASQETSDPTVAG